MLIINKNKMSEYSHLIPPPHSVREQIASLCTVLSLLISGSQICMHLANYNEPHLQLYIIRILMMIPVHIICISYLPPRCIPQLHGSV